MKVIFDNHAMLKIIEETIAFEYSQEKFVLDPRNSLLCLKNNFQQIV